MLAAAQDHSTASVLFICASAFVLLVQWRFKRGRYRLRFPLRSRAFGRRRTAADRFSENQRWEMFERDLGLCQYCGVQVHMVCDWVGGCDTCAESDHVVPVAAGGPTTPENGVTACRFHNRRKGCKTVDQFVAAEARR